MAVDTEEDVGTDQPAPTQQLSPEATTAGLLGIYTNPKVIDNHSEFNDLNGLGQNPQEGIYKSKFRGDASAADYAERAADAYEEHMREHFPDQDETIKEARKRFKDAVYHKARVYALDKISEEYKPAAGMQGQDWWRRNTPFLGYFEKRADEEAIQKSVDAFEQGGATIDAYHSLAGGLAREKAENERGMAAKIGYSAAEFARMGAEFAALGPLGELGGSAGGALTSRVLGAAGKSLFGRAAIYGGEALGTGAAYTAGMSPITAGLDIREGKGLTEIAKDQVSNLIDNTAFAGIGGLGKLPAASRGLVNTAKDWTFSTLKLMAAGELSQDAKDALGLADQPGPLAIIANPNSTKEQRAKAVNDFAVSGGAAALFEAAMHGAKLGMRRDPSKLLDATIGQDLLTRELRGRQEAKAGEAGTAESGPAETAAPAPKPSPDEYIQTPQGWMPRSMAEAAQAPEPQPPGQPAPSATPQEKLESLTNDHKDAVKRYYDAQDALRAAERGTFEAGGKQRLSDARSELKEAKAGMKDLERQLDDQRTAVYSAKMAATPEAPKTTPDERGAESEQKPSEHLGLKVNEQWEHSGTQFRDIGDKTEFTAKNGRVYEITGTVGPVSEGGKDKLDVQVKTPAGERVGQVTFDKLENGKTLNNSNLFVDAAHRQGGIANAMIDFASEEAKKLPTDHPLSGVVTRSEAVGQSNLGDKVWQSSNKRQAAKARMDKLRAAQAGVQGKPVAPAQAPLRAPEAPLTEAEQQAEKTFAGVQYKDVPQELRDRTEKVVDALKDLHDPEAVRQSARSAYAGGGEEGLKELLALQEERFKPAEAPTAENISKAKAELADAMKELSDGVEESVANLRKRGYGEASVRSALASSVQQGIANGQAAIAPQETPGRGGAARPGLPETPGATANIGAGAPSAGPGGREAGGNELNPEHVQSLAAELRSHDAEATADENDIRRQTWDMLAEHGVQPRNYARTYEDASKVPGLDEAADYWKNRRPDLFREGQEPGDVLHSMLQKGMRKPLSAEEAQARAEQHLREMAPTQEEISRVNEALKKEGRAALDPESISEAQRAAASQRAKESLEAGAGDVAHEASGEPLAAGATQFDFGAAEPGRIIGTSEPRQEKVDPVVEFAKDIASEEAASVPLDKAKELVTSAVRHTKDAIDRFAGKMAPTITRLGREAGEAVANMIGAKPFARLAGEHYGDKVLGRGSSPEFDRLVGATLLETRFRVARANGSAPRAGTLVGGQNSPFQSEADYTAALRNHDVKAALGRYEEHYVPEKEKMFRDSQGLDEHDPINASTQIPGRPVSALALAPGEQATGSTVTVGQGAGNLKNLKLYRNPRAMQATLESGMYETDLRRIIEQDLARGYPLAAKAQAYREMEKQGVGRWERSGLQLDGWKEVPFTRPPAGTQAAEPGQVFYVKNEAYGEFRNALNVDQTPAYAKVLSALNWLPNQAALASSVEAASHSVNLATALFTKPSGAWHGGLGDVLYNGYQRIMDYPAFRERLLDLARINAVKPRGMESGKILPEKLKSLDPTYYAGKVLDGLSDVMRMTLSDGFDRMAAKGMVENTPTNKRDFINQSTGQYMKEAQNGFVKWARDTGFGPFATAGTTFNVQAAKSLGLGTNVDAANMRGAVLMRAEVLAKMGAVLGGIAAYNYARWGNPLGDDKTPFMNLKLGEAGGKNVSLDLSPLVLAKRGLRDAGILGYIEARRQGKTEGVAEDKGVMQAVRSLAHPFMGPAVQFGHTALTGQNVFGMQIADRAKQGGSQMAQNMKAALMNANPAVSALTGADQSPRERAKGSAGDTERLMKLLGPFGLQYRSMQRSRGRR